MGEIQRRGRDDRNQRCRSEGAHALLTGQIQISYLGFRVGSGHTYV